MTETTALIALDKITPAELFASGDAVDDLLKRINDTARKEDVDPTTKQGRARLVSIAYQVARSKTTIDGMGKDLVADIKAKAKDIDERRKHIRDTLDALRDDIRKPVDDWDAKEEALRQRLESLRAMQNIAADASSDFICEALKTADATKIDGSWGDFIGAAEAIKDQVIEALNEAYARAKKAEDDAAELARLRAAEAERAEEERKAQAAKEQAEREEQIRKEAAEIERQKAEEEATKRREAEEERRRSADLEHRKTINSAAADALVKAGLNLDDARATITAIAKGTVPNVAIRY